MAIDGTGSNADGTGEGVREELERAGEALVQVQEALAGSSYLSMDSADLEFGLGPGRQVDEIVIFWPSGRAQTLEGVSANPGAGGGRAGGGGAIARAAITLQTYPSVALLRRAFSHQG